MVTPGNFTGYGFDQCLAPTQKAMNAWLKHSPFLSVGIYISGDSRACRSQPNLTRDWIGTQLRKGWRLLPITLGPQASCSTRFPRYGNDETIKPRPGTNGKYRPARRQGRAEAVERRRSREGARASSRAARSGTTSRASTTPTGTAASPRCRSSAPGPRGSTSSTTSPASTPASAPASRPSTTPAWSGPQAYVMPDAIWLARWDGVANTSSSYIREDGWRPGGRVKQYQGGHDETWGGVRINIDRNFLDLGKGSVAAPETHCDGVPVDLPNYAPVKPGSTATDRVRALQCLLTEKGVYDGKLSGAYSPATIEAVHAWQEQRGLTVSDRWTRTAWMTLLAAGPRTIVKFGSAGPEVRRIQRALNAASRGAQLEVTGVFAGPTDKALRAYQDRVGLTASGVAAPATWKALRAGTR